jgi:hypothetical protein
MSQKRKGTNPEDPKTEADADPQAEVATEVEPVALETQPEAEESVTINVVQVDETQFFTKEQLINAMGDQSALAKAGAAIASSACSVCGYEPRYDPYGARVCPADFAECPIL